MKINQHNTHQHYSYARSLSGCGGPEYVSAPKAIIMHLACHCEMSNEK